ncbi:MAG TPA: tetratricopeptide repeat protein [Planctomycetaceae bacterium]|nr:tetratricopeptide repeat protein [Planctomycetaceae bacterium]
MADFVPYTTSSSVSPGSGARRCAPGNLWLILLVAALSGCRWSGTVAPWPHDLAEPRRARHEAAATTFEQSRAGAEYREAEQQWEEGDAAGCIQRLERLLERNPDYWEARVLLAEVLLTQDQPERARQWLLPAIRDHSDHPRLHYTMALALEKLGHAEEANAFYRRAMAALPGGQSTHGAGTAPQATWARSPRSPKRLLGGLLKGRTLRRVAAGLRQPGVLGRERVHGLPSASSHAQACQMASSARDDSTTGRGPLGQGSEGSSVQQCAASGAPPGARSSRSTGPEDPGRAPVGGHGQSGIRGATSGVGECSVERASYRPQSKPSTGSAAASPFGPARGPRDRKQGAELSAEQWLRRGLEALDRGAPEAALEDF